MLAAIKTPSFNNLSFIAPNAIAWEEHGTTFVGLDLGDNGRLVLGYDEDPTEAYRKALANQNG